MILYIFTSRHFLWKVILIMKELIIGLDFNNLVYGSYYGEKLINSKGINVNAIQSFFYKMKMLIENLNPNYIVLANDISRDKTFRRKIFPAYKSTRKPTDEDIITQMKYCSQLAALLGFPFINDPLYEADDILRMISKYATENNMEMIIISSDRDLYQLINDSVFIYSLKNREIIDRNWMYSKYRIYPEQWVELKILMGDRSDNIPGIEGIGEIGALKLLYEFKTIENIYSHLSSVKPALKDKLINGRDSIELMRKLVTIVTDYNLINFNREMIYRQNAYPDEVYGLLEELELNSLINVMRFSLLA